MASLQNTKRRIKSVEATMKITKAMELVSSAKLKKAKDLYNEVAPVQELANQNLAFAVYEIAKILNLEEYLKEDENGKTLFVVIASDMGLCGGYNINVAKEAYSHSKPGDQFILIGKKTYSYLSMKNADIKKVFSNQSKIPNLFDMYYVTREVINALKSNEVQNVKLVYTQFINSVSFNPKIKSLIPVEKPMGELAAPLDNVTPDEYLMEKLLVDYFSLSFYTAFVESKVCEYASSRMAMENATDNANEIKDSLLLEYNRVRQANITQEISEIVGGADAL